MGKDKKNRKRTKSKERRETRLWKSNGKKWRPLSLGPSSQSPRSATACRGVYIVIWEGNINRHLLSGHFLHLISTSIDTLAPRCVLLPGVYCLSTLASRQVLVQCSTGTAWYKTSQRWQSTGRGRRSRCGFRYSLRPFLPRNFLLVTTT